ncbi:Gfo/Idh/MocA family oxidoreductase [Pelagicoccus sp. SDUM812002]|uniref:Gfo/Idh/MocA family oxidoreductase n=1 Tax=Pelagicoccus sp. SDUM812002 TaxID=3041266 RepID=UPI00280F8A37|nr:Gfo/Idh/MocA family oxidoreductase [Pelagicoccus sp. SDUM812002]MDQ8187419.1 Gfo/Idh/MocA family oxidoreductase [Pelagicoccus sp. SDUM812002]
MRVERATPDTGRRHAGSPQAQRNAMRSSHMDTLDQNKQNRRKFLQQVALGTAALGTFPRLLAQPSPSPSSRKLGVTLCGLGSYSTGQLGPALRQTEHCELSGVVTGDPEKGRRWAREYGFPESSVYGYDTIEEMADNDDIDILYSVTPPALHKRDTLLGFKAGKHVISEKPMAMDVAECDEMLAAARHAGKQLAIGYRAHFHPYYELLKDAAADSRFGNFTDISGGFGFNYRPGGTWRMKRDMGGGPLMDLGVYVLYVSAMAKNEQAPIAVTAKIPTAKFPNTFDEVEETMYFTIEYADGSTCDGETSWVQPSNHFRAEGDKGWFETGPAYSYGGLNGKTSIQGALPSYAGFNQQAKQMDSIALDFKENQETIVPGELGRREIQIIQAIREAARTGKRILL